MMALIFFTSAVFTVIPTLTHQRFDGMSLIGVILMLASAAVIFKRELKDNK